MKHQHLLYLSLIAICVWSLLPQGLAVEVPPELNICYRDDPELNDCLKDSIQSFLPQLKEELPSLNLPPMDPYVSEDVKLNYSVIDAFVGKFSVNEVYTFGLSSGIVKSVTTNTTAKGLLKLTVQVLFPEGEIIGSYEGTTRVGVIPFESAGPFSLTIKNALLKWKIKAKPKKVKNVEYMQVKSFKFSPLQIGHMTVDMEGLFPSEQLTKSTVNLINGNWKLFTRQLLPATQNYFGGDVVKTLNKIFMKIPYDQLMPKGYKKEEKDKPEGDKPKE